MRANELILNGVDVKTLFANLKPSEEMRLITTDEINHVALEDVEYDSVKVVELGVKNIVVEGDEMFTFSLVSYDRVEMIIIVKEDRNLTILK